MSATSSRKSSRGDGGPAPAVPLVVQELLGVDAPELIWHNELGGLTYRHRDRFVKWTPHSAGVDLRRERVRLDWMEGRHPAPSVVDFGHDDRAQWMVTIAVEGEMVVGESWRTNPEAAIDAIAMGLRTMHAVPIDDFPPDWIGEVWHSRHPDGIGDRPPCGHPVLVHGDACAPNTLADRSGAWTGHVDLGDLGVGDRWADLAIASLSLAWNYGGAPAAMERRLFDAYGIEPDGERIEYYRRLWHLEA